jgi:hypothetical protein
MISLSVFDALRHAVDLRLAEVDALPQGIQTWMVFMRSLFLSSILFVIWKVEARFVLAMALTTALLIIGTKAVFPEIHSGQIGQTIHIIVWTPVLLYLFSRRAVFLAAIRAQTPISMVYGIWALLVIAVLTISLSFDYAGAIKALLGAA